MHANSYSPAKLLVLAFALVSSWAARAEIGWTPAQSAEKYAVKENPLVLGSDAKDALYGRNQQNQWYSGQAALTIILVDDAQIVFGRSTPFPPPLPGLSLLRSGLDRNRSGFVLSYNDSDTRQGQ
jgi:hypothetical protein